MSEGITDKKNFAVLGGVEVHVKFTRYMGDFGIQLDFTPPAGSDGAPQVNREINSVFAGLCRSTVMEMDDESRLRLLALVEQDGGNDRMLYRLVVTTRTRDGVPEIRIEDRIDPAFSRLDIGVAGRAARCRAEIERLLDEPPEELHSVPEEMFEVLEKANFPPEIEEHTEDEVRQGLLEGREFLFLEMQVIGSVEKYHGRDSLALDYIAAMNQKALSSDWMKEKIRFLSKACGDTIMATGMIATRKISAVVRKTQANELCLYRLAVWCSMNDDGSPRYRISDRIDPDFSRHDPAATKRSEETRRLAAIIMEEVPPGTMFSE